MIHDNKDKLESHAKAWMELKHNIEEKKQVAKKKKHEFICSNVQREVKLSYFRGAYMSVKL